MKNEAIIVKMSGLIDIIGKDLANTALFTRGLVQGVVYGLYTPFAINSGINHGLRNIQSDKPSIESFGDLLGQIEAGVFSQFPLISYAMKHDRLKEYLGILVVTNLGDYLINAYKRAKKQ